MFISCITYVSGSAFYLGFGSGSVASLARDVIVYIPTSMWESSIEIVDDDIITVPRVWNEVYEKQEEKKGRYVLHDDGDVDVDVGCGYGYRE